MLRFLVIPLLLLSFATIGQKTKDHSYVVAEIADKIQAANFNRKQVRLAVVTFVPIQAKEQSNTFGEYITESIIGKLSDNREKFRLFERKRVDAILKENEFMLSGMIKASEAVKIGELLPIDALFSGTYTRLKNYIDVTGRLIDVESGEILMSYTGRIRLTKNIKAVFPEAPGPAVVQGNTSKGQSQVVIRKEAGRPADAESNCSAATERFREKLNDLSTSEKIDQLAAEAMKTPFDGKCGKLHYHFISALSRYGLFPAAYQQFLLTTLDTIAYPAGDERAHSILGYVTRDGVLTEETWRIALNTIRKVGDYSLSSYLAFVFNRVDMDSAVQQKRSDEYFRLLDNQQVGLPRAVSFDKGFYEMMEALTANPSLRMYVYRKHHHRLVTEADNVVGVHLMYLKRMYSEEENPAKKSMIMTWIANYFLNHSNGKSGDQLYDLAREFLPYPDDEGGSYKIEQNTRAAVKFSPRDLEILVSKCSKQFAAYALATPYPSQKQDRISFCARTGIPIENVIPTIGEAKAILEGSNLDEQLRVLKLLALMGNKAAPLETQLISILDRRVVEGRDKLAEMQTISLRILGSLKTSNRKALQYMVSTLKNYDKAAEISTEALVGIGKPAVGLLSDQLKNTTIHDGGLRYRLIAILGRIGYEARSTAPLLKSLLSETTNQDIRYAIEAALQAFGER